MYKSHGYCDVVSELNFISTLLVVQNEQVFCFYNILILLTKLISPFIF